VNHQYYCMVSLWHLVEHPVVVGAGGFISIFSLYKGVSSLAVSWTFMTTDPFSVKWRCIEQISPPPGTLAGLLNASFGNVTGNYCGYHRTPPGRIPDQG
jgi:hypothetical protein